MSAAAVQGVAPAEQTRLFWACVHEACAALLREEAALCALDRAVGDGDHGTNMARGARAILAAEEQLRALPIAQALEKAGQLIITHVGGASGPLYGSLLLATAHSWPSEPSVASIAAALTEGVAAVGRRGRSTVGQKTVLDVLVPAAEALRTAADTRMASESIAAMLAAADAGFETSRALRAGKGRAAYVGERSMGHHDPGAASARLCLHAVARVLLVEHSGEVG